MPKIVLLLDSPLIATGYASTCRLTAKELKSRGYDVYCVSFNGGPQSQEPADWYGLKILPNYALPRNPNAIYGDAEAIKKIYYDIKPDIMFFHNDSYRYSYIPELPKEILDRSVFWLPFEGDVTDQQGVGFFSCCASTRFVTHRALDMHKEFLAGKDIGVIPHAIDLESYRPATSKAAAKAAKKLNLDDKFVVVRVDRHQPRKYWNLTLEAFAKFAKDKKDVFLLAKCNPRDCVMWDEAKQSGVDLEKIATDLGIRHKVFFDDFFFSSPAMAQCFYHAADVFLTTTSGEGFGICPVEAMACGLPVICPDTPVLPEVLGDGAVYCKLKGREWYTPMNVFHNIVDVDDVASKLEWAYGDWKNNESKQLKEMGDKGYQLANARYSPKAVYDAWDTIFRDAKEKQELVSIITVLYNIAGEPQITGEDGIDKFHETIMKFVKHPYEWIIVDNGSPATKETRDWLATAAAKNPRLKPLLLDVNLGFAGACNAGIAMAKGKSIILANPDSEVLDPQKLALPHDFVKMMVDKAKSDPEIGIVGMTLNKRDDIMPGLEFPYFCNVLITRPCLDAIKKKDGEWLDERYWPGYYEDSHTCLEAQGKGFKVVPHNVPFWHKSGGTNKYAIEGGVNGPYVKHLEAAINELEKTKPQMADWGRKRGELLTSGMQGLIQGNISMLRSEWGYEARQKIKIVWNTHIGASVGFSQIVEGLVPELHKLGFDLYVNDWSNGANVEDPLIRQLIEKTRKANEDGDELNGAINIVAWLMESFLDVDAEYKVGISFCESTKVRPQYLQACNGMDRILTFSEFCKGVQKNSGFTSPIHVLPPGCHQIFSNYYERPIRDKYTFLAVGVAQERKDTRRLVAAFCEAFPKDADYPPECEPGFPLKPSQVELVLKSNNFGDLGWVHSEGYSRIANIRTVFTGWDARAERKDMTMQEMYDLYTSADCLLNPSHGEGLGMSLVEGAATGIPMIFTNWSSPAEYWNESNSYPCSLGPNGTDFSDAYPGAGIPGENGLWSNIHIGHLKHLMRHVIRNRDEARAKGKAAYAMVKDKYNWRRSAETMIPMIFEWEAERARKVLSASFDPLTFQRPSLEPVKKGDRVLVEVCTRDRQEYVATLLVSLLNQTFKEWDLLIQVDDSDESILANYQIKSLLTRANHEGHGTRMIRSHRQGPHIAHDRSLQMAKDDPNYKYKLVCRVDDDIYLTSTYLEKLFGMFLEDNEIAAVGGVYPDPKRSDREQMAPNGYEKDIEYAGKVDHNVPWPYICNYPAGTTPRPVEHLYSSFMYRVEAAVAIGGYCRKFSQIGHREESDFSYRFHLAGWKLYLHPEAKGYHFCAPAGGIRADNIIDKRKLSESDHKIYSRRLSRWKKQMEKRRIRDAEIKRSSIPAPKQEAPRSISSSGKIAVIINSDDDNIHRLRAAANYFGEFSDDIYITCGDADAKTALADMPKVKMVATAPDEIALVTKQVLAEGDHEYIMTVSPKMSFRSDPRSVLCDRYDDYVFETFSTYIKGRFVDGVFVQNNGADTFVGPEIKNFCLITRRRADAKPNLERTCYSDIAVINEENLAPVYGKSEMGNNLILLDNMERINWTKICVYQFPEGQLKQPRSAEMVSNERLVSIIIPTAGRQRLLKQCIDSIYAHTTTPFEIIVVDNASDDGTAEWLDTERKRRPNLKSFRQPENFGYQKAVNIGVSKARGQYILLFNDDAWVQGREPDGRDWLQVYIDELDADRTLGIVGPHGCESPALGEKILFFWCVMVHRSTWDNIGPLDDATFRNYGGDDDWCMRLKAAGMNLKECHTNLRHLMNCVPDHVKNKELAESVIKLRAKYSKHFTK